MRHVNFEVKGEGKRLRYDFNALADIEQIAGVGAEELFSQRRAGFNLIRLLIWGGLKADDPGITLQRAGLIIRNMIDEGKTMEDIGGLIREGLVASGLVDLDEEDEAEEEAENPTGKNSQKGSGNSKKKHGK